MHDRAVRRRRAVLALLVTASLILLTAYYGESQNGRLHSAQRGALGALSPIQEGASRVLKPFRDLFGWFGDTIDAKSENKSLKKERDELRQRLARVSVAAQQGQRLQKLFALDRDLGLDQMHPVTARVVLSSPTLWYSTVNINRGSSDGVTVDDPVLTSEGLVGRVTKVVGDAAQVTLLTDPVSGVTARIAESGVAGIVQTGTPGNPNDLLLQRIPRGDRVRVGQQVVSAGIKSARLTSYFPPEIPIGVITRVDPNELESSQQVHMRPYADLRDLDIVQVLTKPSQRSTGPS
jgi:rod shape-determining protein MreC